MPSCTSVNIFKSPQSGGTLCFQFVSGAGAAAATMTFASHVKTVWARQRKYGSGKMYWVTFGWPWLKVTAVTLINKNLLVCRIKWEPLNQSLQNFAAITLRSWSSPDYILEECCWKPFFCQIFLENFGCVFSRSNTLLDSGMVGLIDVKWKGGASVGHWVNYVTLTFDLTHDLDLWFFKVKFQNSCIWGIVIWLMWNKKKANQLVTGLTSQYGLALWPHPWPWPCNL